jgi:hypothetical protein
MLRVHRFIPRILKRPNIKRKEVSGYPSLLKKRVAKAIVPRKRIICFLDPGISTTDSLFTGALLSRKRILRRKMPDRIIRRIPKRSGNIPVPAFRKVPMSIFKERRVVAAPKRKRTITLTVSSFFIPSSHFLHRELKYV